MEIVKRKTGRFCNVCDSEEAEYVMSSRTGTKYKLRKTCWGDDGEIAFCETCAIDLYNKLGLSLGNKVQHRS